LPTGRQRRGSTFWRLVSPLLNISEERGAYHDGKRETLPVDIHDGVSAEIATIRRWEAARQPPVVTVGELVSEAGTAVATALSDVGKAVAKVAKVTKTQRAVEWLAQVLRDGPVPQKEIEAKAVKDAIGTKPLKLAKAKLKVQSTRKGRAAWAWVLPFAKAKEGQEASVAGEFSVHF
jgi:hypothetical protein